MIGATDGRLGSCERLGYVRSAPPPAWRDSRFGCSEAKEKKIIAGDSDHLKVMTMRMDVD
jgi:hypothetical protein